MIITKNGIIIRVDVNKISTIGRNTQGVKLIALENGDQVIDLALCEKETSISEDISVEGDGQEIPESIPEALEEKDAEKSFDVPVEDDLEGESDSKNEDEQTSE
jgi:DNA gyrase subunit A